jgi:hypothetical protein
MLDRLASLLRAHRPERLALFWESVMARKRPASSTLSQVILNTINERGLTSYALGKASGVSAVVLQRFVNGERGLSLKTAEKLAEALGLELRPRDRVGSEAK